MARKKTVVASAPVVEVSEEKPGLGFEDGIVLSTSLVLAIAVVLAYLQYSSFYAV
jgi:hypothetical protein